MQSCLGLKRQLPCFLQYAGAGGMNQKRELRCYLQENIRLPLGPARRRLIAADWARQAPTEIEDQAHTLLIGFLGDHCMFHRTPGVVPIGVPLISKGALPAWESLESGVSFDLTSCGVMADRYSQIDTANMRSYAKGGPTHRISLSARGCRPDRKTPRGSFWVTNVFPAAKAESTKQ